MTIEEMKDLSRFLVEELLNKKKLAVIDELFSEDFVNHDPMLGQAPDRGGLKMSFSETFNAFPDIQFIIDNLIAEDDKVTIHLTIKGTHKGPLMGIPPTGKQFEYSSISIARIVDGKIVERWNVQDVFSLLQQLDLLSIKGME